MRKGVLTPSTNTMFFWSGRVVEKDLLARTAGLVKGESLDRAMAIAYYLKQSQMCKKCTEFVKT